MLMMYLYMASYAAMTIFPFFTREYLNMKEAPGKFGGNFSGTMVSICDDPFAFGNAILFLALTLVFFFNLEQSERQLKLGILILKLLLSG